MLKIIIHLIDTGKASVDRETNRGKRVIKNLVSYKNSRRNISMNNFFTILSLAKHFVMEFDNCNNLKKNKAYISQEIKSSKSRQTFSTIFGFHVMICIYVPKVSRYTAVNDALLLPGKKKTGNSIVLQ